MPSLALLSEKSSDDSLFMRAEWQATWWKHYGQRRRFVAVRVEEGDRLVGYGAFMTTGLGKLIKTDKLEFVATGQSDLLGILAESDRKDVIEAVLDGVIDGAAWDVGELRDMRETGPTAMCVLDRFPEAEVSKEVCPSIRVRASFQEYLSTLSQNARHNIVRNKRRNVEGLDAKFARIDEPEELPSALGEFFRLNEMRWSDKGEDTVLTTPMRDFLREAVVRLAAPRISVIHALRVGEKNIAMCLGFEYHDRYFYYLSGLDPAYSKQSPGRYLLARIIEEAHERRLKEIDLLRGGEEYKYHLGAEERYNVIVKFRNPRSKRGHRTEQS